MKDKSAQELGTKGGKARWSKKSKEERKRAMRELALKRWAKSKEK